MTQALAMDKYSCIFMRHENHLDTEQIIINNPKTPQKPHFGATQNVAHFLQIIINVFIYHKASFW